jgi:ferredoxin
MTHVIAAICTREGDCVEVCPVDCIIPGPTNDPEWNDLFFIDPDTCIDCGACIPECPFEAIFPEDEVPSSYEAKGGERVSMPVGTAGHSEPYDGSNHHGEAVHLEATRALEAGEVVDLTKDISPNYDYFQKGPGYDAVK